MKRIMVLAVLVAVIWALVSCSTPKARWHEPRRPAVSPSVTPSLQTARQGAPCSPEGSRAKTASGNPMVCLKHPNEPQARWRMEFKS